MTVDSNVVIPDQSIFALPKGGAIPPQKIIESPRGKSQELHKEKIYVLLSNCARRGIPKIVLTTWHKRQKLYIGGKAVASPSNTAENKYLLLIKHIAGA